MRSYFELVLHVIKDEIGATHGQQTRLIRIEDVPHPKVYLDLATALERWSKQANLDLVAKLSHGKYTEFRQLPDPSIDAVLEKMMSHGYIDEDNHMTFWRNQAAEGKQLTLLMGTEAVEDKGGLGDFFAITSDVLDQRLNGNYAQWFEKLTGCVTGKEEDALNNLVDGIFRVSSRNLYRLSTIIDDLQQMDYSGDVNTLVEHIFGRLYGDWGIPSLHTGIPPLTELANKNRCRDLFNELGNFRDRGQLRDLSRRQLQRQIEKIEQSTEAPDSPSQTPNYSSVDALKADLSLYVMGEDLVRVRPLVLSCDYTFIKNIMQSKKDLSSGTGPGPRPPKQPEVLGGPAEAFLEMIVTEVANVPCVQELRFQINRIQLAGCATEEDTHNLWERIRLCAGGLLEHLSSEFADSCDLLVTWVDDEDPFAASLTDSLIQDGLITRASGSKKLCEVNITIVNDQGEATDCVWKFSPHAPWTYTFYHVINGLVDAYHDARHGAKYIPMAKVNNLVELTISNNEEEFFSKLEAAAVNYSLNVVEHIESLLPANEHSELLRKIGAHGQQFTGFLTDLQERGFYATFGEGTNTATLFISGYCALLDWIGNTPLTSKAKAALSFLTNAFLLEDELGNEHAGAIVLPVHPAMLEKLIEKAQFVRQGTIEILTALRNADLNKRQAVERLRTFDQLSTITMGVDILLPDQSHSLLSEKHTFGSFSIYHNGVVNSTGGFLSSVVTDDVAADESIPKKEFVRNSPISEVVLGSLADYIATFPTQRDGLHVVFINPPDLQPVVSALHSLINTLTREADGTKVRVRLTILAPTVSLGSRSYLHYWLDKLFWDADEVDITTYFKTLPFSEPNLGALVEQTMRSIPKADVTFIQNIMNVERVSFESAPSKAVQPSQTRFPMVFYPLPVSTTSQHRRTTVSQLQFEASSAHTRLVRYIRDPMNPFVHCQAVNQLQLQSDYATILSAVHDYSRWVVCIDPGIDRDIIAGSNQRIIGFATGEGPFGELNVTISSRHDSSEDLNKKLDSRLKSLFGRWSDNARQSATAKCLSSAEKLDGAQLLKALNPHDYELHSFLSYVLTAQYLKVGEEQDNTMAVRTLIPLDSYAHWFSSGVDPSARGPARRPDFLLLEVAANDADDLTIQATMIECKMGKESLHHIDEGTDQLARGISVLRTLWDPGRDSIDRRYWYSQLYRAIVFSKMHIADNDPLFDSFNKRLQGILDGSFAIVWKGLLLTYWLDSPSDAVETHPLDLEGVGIPIPAEHHEFGQLAIQHMLVDEDSEIKYAPYDEFGDGDERYDGEDCHDANGTMPNTVPVDTSSGERTDTETTSLVATGPANYVQSQRPLTANADTGDGTVLAESPDDSEVTPAPEDTDSPVIVAPDTSTIDRPPSGEIRLLIGEDTRNHESVYWEYGHPGLQNRHILITGSSGSGKTYFMQALLLELSRHGVSSLIFDYTDGFTPHKLEPELKEALGDRITQLSVYRQPFPLNPFKTYDIEIAGDFVPQNPVDVAERIKSSFTKVFGLGEQQANTVYTAVRDGVTKYGSEMSLNHLRKGLQVIGESNSSARTTLGRIEPLIDREPFDHTNTQDWSILDENPGSIVIVQLSGFTRDVQLIITELILWDAWYYNVMHGDKDKPFPVILDEAQNLDHSANSPSTMVLTEGRKFGWSGWFATQFLKGQIQSDGLGRLQQAAQKVFFKPPETELRDVALMIDPDRAKAQDWAIRLSKLQKGECIVSGWTIRNGKLVKDRPRIVKVSALSARGGNA